MDFIYNIKKLNKFALIDMEQFTSCKELKTEEISSYAVFQIRLMLGFNWFTKPRGGTILRKIYYQTFTEEQRVELKTMQCHLTQAVKSKMQFTNLADGEGILRLKTPPTIATKASSIEDIFILSALLTLDLESMFGRAELKYTDFVQLFHKCGYEMPFSRDNILRSIERHKELIDSLYTRNRTLKKENEAKKYKKKTVKKKSTTTEDGIIRKLRIKD